MSLIAAFVASLIVASAALPAADAQAAPPTQATPAQAAPAQATPRQGQQPAGQRPGTRPAPVAVVQNPVPPPPGYVIGAEDVLQILFRYDQDLTTEVTVRPDGMISLPMLSDVHAAGLTPEQLRDQVTESAKRFIEDPAVTVIVRTINSRKVFITGEVTRPGPYNLTTPTTVVQLIAMAGGLTEFADKGKITIMRMENGKPVSYKFNYKDVANGRNLKQNIELRPGDTVIVP